MNKNVPVSELQIGMYISDVGNEWIPAKRKKRKGYIRSQATIDKILSLGVKAVCIEFPSETTPSDVDSEPEQANTSKALGSGLGKIVKITDKIVMNDSKHAQKHGDFVEEQPDKKLVKKTLKKTSSIKEIPTVSEDSTIAPRAGLLDEIKNNKNPSGSETSLPKKGGLLDEIKANQKNDVSIPTTDEKSHPAPREGIAQRAKKYLPGAVVIPFAQEYDRARTLHSEAKEQVEEAMLLAKVGKPFDIDGIEKMADGLIDSIISNRNTLCMMTALKSQDNYLYEHSVNCGVLTGIFARHLKLSIDIVHDLVTGAILHDIGMIEVPQEIINKSSKLTPAEEKEMQRHIVTGRKILEKNRGVPAIAFEVCKQHHERLDGQGYMQKMHGHQVNQYGRVGAIVDMYDALTSNRNYRKAFSPAAAMKKLLEMSGSQLDAKLVYQFIQCINIYPVGSLVQLDDSRVGVVHELNVFKKDKPKVRVFYSGKDKNYFEAKTVDLADPNVRIKIKQGLDIEDFDIELEDVI